MNAHSEQQHAPPRLMAVLEIPTEGDVTIAVMGHDGRTAPLVRAIVAALARTSESCPAT